MKRMLLALATAATVGASIAPAQPIGQPPIGQPPALQRPAISPFLNLNRGGLPAVNYYGLVRPQIETQQALTTLNQDVRQGLLVPQGLGGQQLQTLTTGHGAVYFNTGHYYPGFQGQFTQRFSTSSGVVPNASLGYYSSGIGVAPNTLGVGGIGIGIFGR